MDSPDGYEPHDLAYSKLAARREKDLAFVAALIRHKLIQSGRMKKLVAAERDEHLRERLHEAWTICQRRLKHL